MRILKKLVVMLLGIMFMVTAGTAEAARSVSSKAAVQKVSSMKYTLFDAQSIFRIELSSDRAGASFAVRQENGREKSLIIDMPQTQIKKLKKRYKVNNAYVKEIRVERLNKNNCRVRVVLAAGADALAWRSETSADGRNGSVFALEIYNKYTLNGRIDGRMIVIDPGHGGSDTGAIGYSGSLEKDVTLATAELVKDFLQKAGAKVIMTRETDIDVAKGKNVTDRGELEARVQVGRRCKADVFLSIHANAFSSAAANGTETFYYFKTVADEKLAQCLQNGMLEYGKRRDRGIAEANFYVVKYSRMPAALVELAFISNAEEEDLLTDGEFQTDIAHGIAQGIINYFKAA